jgi:hypothetical protein
LKIENIPLKIIYLAWERILERLNDHGMKCLAVMKNLEIHVYSNESMPRSWKFLKTRFNLKYVHVSSFGETEIADLYMIATCFAAVSKFSHSEYLHVILVSADKDFHNLFTELRTFRNVRTHSLSAQSGSSLAALAHYALEMEKVYKPVPHVGSPVQVPQHGKQTKKRKTDK